jgi:hypothetical protein
MGSCSKSITGLSFGKLWLRISNPNFGGGVVEGSGAVHVGSVTAFFNFDWV